MKDSASDEPRTRVQFEFIAPVMQQLRDLKTQTNASSYAEVVRNALKAYESLLNKRKV